MAGNDDIVARLRETQDNWPAALVVLEMEAASEIERLRDLFRLDGEQHAQRIKGLTEAHEARITKYAAALAERDATIERLTKERSEFARSLSEWATKAGEAEGRLKASEWPGIVDGWKDRATAAERERAEARAEVERLRKVVKVANDAIAEYVRYLDGGEMRGSYDGKPERNGLRKAGYAARAALQQSEVKP